jgi:argininosuccinate synthase
MALVTAHQDLERLVSTREQNRFKSLVDQAWTNLVYDGFWFDAQRTSLEAYIDDVNQWVTGEVTLRFATGAVQAVARCSEHGLYDEEQAVYRFGQDFAAADPAVVASARSPHMRAVVRRQRAGRDRAGTR